MLTEVQNRPEIVEYTFPFALNMKNTVLDIKLHRYFLDQAIVRKDRQLSRAYIHRGCFTLKSVNHEEGTCVVAADSNFVSPYFEKSIEVTMNESTIAGKTALDGAILLQAINNRIISDEEKEQNRFRDEEAALQRKEDHEAYLAGMNRLKVVKTDIFEMFYHVRGTTYDECKGRLLECSIKNPVIYGWSHLNVSPTGSFPVLENRTPDFCIRPNDHNWDSSIVEFFKEGCVLSPDEFYLSPIFEIVDGDVVQVVITAIKRKTIDAHLNRHKEQQALLKHL